MTKTTTATTAKLALLDAGYTIQAQINTLTRGLPIAETKAKRELDKITIRKTYNAQIAALREQLKAINAAMLLA